MALAFVINTVRLELDEMRRMDVAYSLLKQFSADAVPTDHWAYSALNTVWFRGNPPLVIGYPDGALEMTWPLMLEDFAAAIRREAATLPNALPESGPHRIRYVLSLQRLAHEFRPELSAIDTDVHAALSRVERPFPDMPGNEHWAVTGVRQAWASGILIGYPDGSFRAVKGK